MLYFNVLYRLKSLNNNTFMRENEVIKGWEISLCIYIVYFFIIFGFIFPVENKVGCRKIEQLRA